MKVFGINFGSSSDSNLNPNQTLLKMALLPAFKSARAAGYPAWETGKALQSHFERTKETITIERAKELLGDPESLILSHRKATNKPNAPSGPQGKMINRTFLSPEDRARVQQFLMENFVVDLIPVPRFMEVLQQLAAAKLAPSTEQITQWKKRL
jgi:hypothetical protein